MKHKNFKIGLTFFTGTGKWICTDIGTRTIAAIHIQDKTEESWKNGPPYDIVEHVFDEYDFGGCSLQPFGK